MVRVAAPKNAGAGQDLPEELLQTAAARFGMLAAAVRLHIVWLLAQGPRDVGSLADEVGATPQVVSQHLAKLRLAGFVHARREGRRQVYLVDDRHLVTVVRGMVAHLERDQAWSGRIRAGA